MSTRPLDPPGASPPAPFADAPSIVDLAAAIAARFARPSVSPAAIGEPSAALALANPVVAAALAEARQVVLLVLDGLGARQVETLIAGGALAAARSGTLRSVFPSSTAPAISSFASARHPSVHANPGWFCWSDSLEAVVRTLPMDIRAQPGSEVDAAAMWDWVSASERAAVPVFAIQPKVIADSRFSSHAWSGATRLGYESASVVPEMVAAVLDENPSGAFVWAYLPHFDTVSHEKGWQSEAAVVVAQRLDALFAALAYRLRHTGALLLATADHGFIDVPPEQQLRLEDYPELAALLARPLTGEPRVAYCQARAGLEEAFAQTARAALGFAFDVAPSAALAAAGWFGPGPVSPRLAGRIGTHTLIARDRYTLVDQLPGEPPAAFVGMHGGIHEDELWVPLAAIRRAAPL